MEATLGAGSDPPAAAPADLTELSLEDLSSLKVQTVYGASKHEQEVSQAPASVSIVTADDIKKSGYRTLAEVLNGVRGFYTTSDRTYSYIGVRGFNRPGDYGSELLIMVDGHRMNDAIYGEAFNGMEFLLDVDLIERVEVIRGPGSSLYGDNAFFGVINVITRRGKDFGGAEASGAYASYDTSTGRLSYGQRLKNDVEFVVSGTYFDSGGHDRLYYQEFSQLNHGYADRVDSSYASSAFASLDYHDFSLEGGFVQRHKDIPTGAYGAVFNDPRNDVLDERAFAELGFHRQFEQDWQVTARLYYDHYFYEGNVPEPEYGYPDPLYPGHITINRDLSRQESMGGEVQVGKELFEKDRVTGGVEYRRDFVLDQENFDLNPPATYIRANIPANTVGVYAQDEYSVLHNLTVTGGVRYDYFSSFGDTVNPRAALIYSPWTNSTFKALYGQAFRAPNAYELYYEAPGYASDTRLKPETIHSYELVYEQVITPQLHLSTSLFCNDIENLINFGTNASGANVFGNLSGATSRGGEAELDANVAKGWRARLSYTYADARDSATNQRLSNSPEHMAKLNVTAPVWPDLVFLNVELLGLSSRRTVEGMTTGGYCVANATIFSREIVKGLEASASVYNLFDQHYSDPASSDFPEHTILQDGRNFRLKLTYRF